MAPRSGVAPLDLEEEKVVKITIPIPESLHVSLYHYCLWRKVGASKIPVAATKALMAFVENDRAFAEWRASQSNLPPRVPDSSRRRREPQLTASPEPAARPSRS